MFGDPRLPERFWKKVSISESGCWEWLADRLRGYGRFHVTGDRPRLAHRVAYSVLVSPIAQGSEIDHLCRNRGCVNPHHLEPVSPLDNWLRSQSPSVLNMRKTHCAMGHPLTEGNLYYQRSAPSTRKCKTCQQRRMKSYRQRKKGETNG